MDNLFNTPDPLSQWLHDARIALQKAVDRFDDLNSPADSVMSVLKLVEIASAAHEVKSRERVVERLEIEALKSRRNRELRDSLTDF